MKNKIIIAFLTLLSASACAVESKAEHVLDNFPLSIYAKGETASVEKEKKNGFKYIRMGASPVEGLGAVPGMGIGYRLTSGSSAADFSASFGARRQKHHNSTYTYTLPKANYLYYFTSNEPNSLYVGGGLAWGGIYKSTETKVDHDGKGYDSRIRQMTQFHGIIANATVGYEMHRTALFRSFVQLDLSQPTLAVVQDDRFPSPYVELGVGIGF